jgi:magnesium-transporting ATPase (P-type)
MVTQSVNGGLLSRGVRGGNTGLIHAQSQCARIAGQSLCTIARSFPSICSTIDGTGTHGPATTTLLELSSNELFLQLQSRKEGLTDDEARERLERYGSNLLKPPKRSDAFALLLSQFKSPGTDPLLRNGTVISWVTP